MKMMTKEHTLQHLLDVVSIAAGQVGDVQANDAKYDEGDVGVEDVGDA